MMQLQQVSKSPTERREFKMFQDDWWMGCNNSCQKKNQRVFLLEVLFRFLINLRLSVVR